MRRRRVTDRANRLLAFTITVATTLIPAAPARADWVRDLQWHLNYLNVTEAHRISRGEGVTVAVVDTGVDARHPDLADAVLPGADLVGDSGNGHTDISGHGTAMAGLIAARGQGNNSGALGIAPRAKILPVRIQVMSYAASEIVRGIYWAIERGARVICVASGGGSSPELEAAVMAALKADVVVVAAAGNRPEATRVEWPAAYPGVIAAAGVDRDGNHAEVSVTGPEVVLAAPAVDIVSTNKLGETRYSTGTGTSSATAIIAGAAALVRAKYPDLSAAEVVHRLTATAVDKGPPGRDELYGYGVLDLVAALTADVPPMPSPTAASQTTGPNLALPPIPEPDEPRRLKALLTGVAYILLGSALLAVAVIGAALAARSRRRG